MNDRTRSTSIFEAGAAAGTHLTKKEEGQSGTIHDLSARRGPRRKLGSWRHLCGRNGNRNNQPLFPGAPKSRWRGDDVTSFGWVGALAALLNG